MNANPSLGHPANPAPVPWHPAQTLQPRRGALARRIGRRNFHAGIAAEERALARYLSRGFQLEGQRVRTPHGELDLIVSNGSMTVFVEVKKSARRHLADSPVPARQWQRLAAAAEYYMVSVSGETGVQPTCRFDVVVMGPDGRIEVYENARSFDSF